MSFCLEDVKSACSRYRFTNSPVYGATRNWATKYYTSPTWNWYSGYVYYSRSTREIWDVYEPYGTGIWSITKPVCMIRRQVDATSGYTGGRNKAVTSSFDHIGTGRFDNLMTSNGAVAYLDTVIADEQYTSALKALENSLWIQVGNQVERQWPTLRGYMPDLLVFLYEAHQLANLFSAIDGLEKDIRNVFEFRNYLTRNRTKLTPRSRKRIGNRLATLQKKLLARIPNEHLAHNFGVKPTVGDICKIILQLVMGASETVQRLKDGQEKIHTMHVHRTGSLAWNQALPGKNVSTGKCQLTKWYVGSTCNTTSACQGETKSISTEMTVGTTVKYRYRLPQPATELERKIGETMSRMGIIGTIDSLWETIPYSFVIDWVFNMDKLFKTLNLNRRFGYDVQIEVMEQCVSRKTKRTTTHSGTGCCSWYNACEQLDTYERIGESVTSQEPWLITPRISQLVLGFSLGVQKVL